MPEPDGLGEAVDGLVDALRAHAEAVRSSDVPAIEAAAEALRALATAYEDLVFERCGAGSVFQDLGELSRAAEGWDDEEEPYAPPAGAARISITGRWDFAVADAEALHQSAFPDGASEHGGTAESESVSASDALDTIAAKQFRDLPGLEFAGGGWKVGPVSLTLFEMTEGERDAIGF